MLTTVTSQSFPYTGTKKLLVIGSDASTTPSDVSYALLEPGKAPKIQPVTRFSDQGEEKSKSKVRMVCYDQDGSVIAVGPKTDSEVTRKNAEWFKLRLRPPRLTAHKRYQLEKICSPPEPAEDEVGNDVPPGIERVVGERVTLTKGSGDERDGTKEDPSDSPSREVVEPELLNSRKALHPANNGFKTPIRIFIVFLQYLFESAKEYYITEPEIFLARLESEVAHPNHILEESTSTLSIAEEAATGREHLTRDLSATNQARREEKTDMAHSSGTDIEQTHILLPPIIVNKADSISVVDVIELVKILNAQIEQGSSLITDSLFDRESPSTGKERETVLDELYDYIGSWLCNDFKRRSKDLIVEPDRLKTQIALQTGLVNACSRIINDWNPPFWIDGLVFSRTYNSIEKTNGRATADAWRAVSRSHMVVLPSERQEANKRYLTEVLLRLITAVGGSLENGILPPQYKEVLEGIVKPSLELHKVVSEDLVPMMELVTDTIPCGTNFDPSRMEDTERGRNDTRKGAIICTMEMGLRCRKRKERGSGEEWGVAMKAKVALASTLEK